MELKSVSPHGFMRMAKSKGIPLIYVLLLIGAGALLIPQTRNAILGLFTTPTEDGIIPTDELRIVNRKIQFTAVDSFSGAQGSGTIKLYESDGKTLLESLTIASGTIASGDYYTSGVDLVAEYNDASNGLLRKAFTVPKMCDADIEAVSNNPLTLKVFVVASSCTRAARHSNGTAFDTNETLNATSGTGEETGSFTFSINVPTDNTGFITSYDEIDGLNWYVILFMKASGTEYEYIDSTGWDVQYAKGTANYYAHKFNDIEVTKYKVGNTYVYSGAASFTFGYDASGISSSCAADMDFWLYAYTDYDYHNARGSYGPDSFSMMTTFKINILSA